MMDEAKLEAAIRELVEDLTDANADGDKDAAIRAVAEFLDLVIPMNVLVPGLPGTILESFDVTVFDVLLRLLTNHIKVDPDRKAIRQARRQERKAKRQAKRNKA